MASRLIDGIIYSEVNGVIASLTSKQESTCVYKLKYKHSAKGYICRTNCGCADRHYLGEHICGYCERPIEFVGRNGQHKNYIKGGVAMYYISAMRYEGATKK